MSTRAGGAPKVKGFFGGEGPKVVIAEVGDDASKGEVGALTLTTTAGGGCVLLLWCLETEPLALPVVIGVSTLCGEVGNGVDVGDIKFEGGVGSGVFSDGC